MEEEAGMTSNRGIAGLSELQEDRQYQSNEKNYLSVFSKTFFVYD